MGLAFSSALKGITETFLKRLAGERKKDQLGSLGTKERLP
jgi:hypothetical protein